MIQSRFSFLLRGPQSCFGFVASIIFYEIQEPKITKKKSAWIML